MHQKFLCFKQQIESKFTKDEYMMRQKNIDVKELRKIFINFIM